VLGGAGLSTESGIKDYRSEKVGHFATTDQRPTKYGDFLKSSKVRQKYWARNATAWPLFKTFKPNKSHKYLATLEHMGILHWLVTQNVDNLHHEAGSRLLTELHGTVFSVICLDCKLKQSRDEVQDQIHALNPSWEAVPQGFAPDADVFISDELVKSFNVPHCTRCGGTLKPDVVFFGDNIPLRRVRAVSDKVAGSDAMMIVGSSLETYSAMRHVMEAKKLNIPILILNIGRTRADLLADTIITARCGEAFSILLDNHIPK
jgi:NAD-dependent deacetylase sirtuin 4